MAANLTLSSLSLATDGKTFTGTVSGGTGTGYAPSSGVTGLTFKNTLNTYPAIVPTATATISGTTISGTLQAAVPQSTTLTLDVATSSNLTDSGANTAQGQTAVSVTNGSTQTGTAFVVGSVPYAYPACQTPTDNGTFVQFATTAAPIFEWAIDVFGTAANFHLYQGSLQFSVDGGAFGANQSAGTAFGIAQAFSGLTEVWHKVVVRSQYFHDKATVTAFGSAPAVRAPAWYGTSYRVRSATVAAATKLKGAWLESTIAPAYDSLRTSFYWGAAITFVTTGSNTGLRVFGYSASQNRPFDVYVDGVFNSTVTINLNWNSQAVVEGLTAGAHTYELREVDSGRSVDFYLCCVSAIGGTLDTTVVPTYPTAVLQAGDSITQNSNSDVPSSTTSSIAVMATNLGIEGINAGISGTQAPTTVDVPNVILLRRPKNVIIYYGSNDKGTGGLTAAQFGTRIQAFLQQLLDGTATHATGLRTTTTDKVCVVLPFPYLNTLDSGYAASVTGAIAALTLPANAPTFVTIPTNGLSKFAGFTSLHPTVAQTAVWGNYLTPWAAVYGFTISGPSSGVSGAASTAFTVTIANGSSFEGSQTVTLSVADGTITATAASGSISGNGTGTVVVTPAANATSFTFTYTPATTGSKTVTPTNGQGWTNPAVVAYTASIPDTTPPSVTNKAVNTAGSVVLTLSEAVGAAGSPSDYALVVGGVSCTISAATLTDSTHIALTPSPVIYQGLTGVTVAYSGTSVKDIANNPLGTFTAQSVTNGSTVPVPDTTPPGVAALAIGTAGTSTVLTLSEPVTAAGTFADYVLKVGGVTRTIGLVSLTDSTHITLNHDVIYKPPVTATIDYTGSSVTDVAGNPLAHFTAQSVTNNSTVPSLVALSRPRLTRGR